MLEADSLDVEPHLLDSLSSINGRHYEQHRTLGVRFGAYSSPNSLSYKTVGERERERERKASWPVETADGILK